MAEPNQNRSKAKTKDIAGSRFLQFSHQVKKRHGVQKKIFEASKTKYLRHQ
jgi:hypothetical protein